MLECLYPKVYLDSTYEIDFEQYYQDGYSGLLPYLRDCTLSDIRP